MYKKWGVALGYAAVGWFLFEYGDVLVHRLQASGNVAWIVGLATVLALVPVIPFPVVVGAIGAALGPVHGALVAWVGSTLASLLMFVAVRYGYRDWGRRLLLRYSRIGSVTKRFERNAFWAIASLRVIPVVPSVAVNLYSALSGVSWATYAAASALGKMPAMLLYASIGSGLTAGEGPGSGLAGFAGFPAAGHVYPITSVLVIAAALTAVLSIVWMSWRNGISPMPASAPVRRAVADELNRLAGPADVVEAGSGWGTLALYVARHCPGKRVIGLENSPLPLWFSRLAARLALRKRFGSGSGTGRDAEAGQGSDTATSSDSSNAAGSKAGPSAVTKNDLAGAGGVRPATAPSRVSFLRKDLYRYPYGEADIVVCYLFPGAMKRLSPIFAERLPPHARVVSICFALPDWRPERIVTCGDVYRTKLYVYSMAGKPGTVGSTSTERGADDERERYRPSR